MDIRLYTLTGEWEDKYLRTGEGTMSAPVDSPAAGRLETLAGKVVKFLCTGLGSDAFDPSYGSRAFPSRLISKNGMALFQSTLLDDITRCVDYLHNSEAGLGDDVERLKQVFLRRLVYAPGGDATRVDAWLEITTDRGNQARVAISGGTANV